MLVAPDWDIGDSGLRYFLEHKREQMNEWIN